MYLTPVITSPIHRPQSSCAPNSPAVMYRTFLPSLSGGKVPLSTLRTLNRAYWVLGSGLSVACVSDLTVPSMTRPARMVREGISLSGDRHPPLVLEKALCMYIRSPERRYLSLKLCMMAVITYPG